MLKRPTKQAAMRKRWANKKNNNSSSLSTSTPLAPPVYKLHSHVTEHHGCKRNDDFYWLCDRSNRKVKQLLKTENKYMERFFTLADNTTSSSSSSLRRKLFREIASRIRSSDISLPSRERSYWYYSRYVEHEEHPLLCRRPYCALHEININFANEVSALWESNPNAPLPFYDDEEIYLDLNLLKEQLHLDHVDIGEIDISHDEQQLVLTVDWSSGKEVFAVLVMNIGHVDYASWLKHHAHPLHRVWAEREHRAGQSIYGSPTRRSPLFAPVSNTSWQNKIANSNNSDHHRCCEENCNSPTCTNHSSKDSDVIIERETKEREYNNNSADDVNCDNFDACQECTWSNNISMPSVSMVESNSDIEVNNKKNFTRLPKRVSNSRHLPLHDIVCVIDDIAIGDEVMWADETHLLYFALDDKMRPYQLIYHTLSSHLIEEEQEEQQEEHSGTKEEADKLNNANDNTKCVDRSVKDLDIVDDTKPDYCDGNTLVEDVECGDDIICYEENDEAFWLGGLTRTADEQFCMFTTSSSEKSESYVCPTTTTTSRTKEEIHIDHNSDFVRSCQMCSCHKLKEHVVECQISRPVLTHPPIVRATAMNDSTIENRKEFTSPNEHSILTNDKEQNTKEYDMEESLLHHVNNSKAEEFKETWHKSGEMICFAPRHESECQPFEYEMDHHDCLLAEKTHKSNSGAWVIVSNAHGCTNHAVFILPDEEVMGNSLPPWNTTINTNMNIEHDEIHKTEIGDARNMPNVTDRQYSLTCSAQWRLLFTYDEAVKVEHVELFRDFLLVSVRKHGNPTVLFCPVSLIHNWWHQQKQTSKSTVDKNMNAITINYLTDLQDIVQNSPLRSSSSSSSSSTLENVQQSITFKIPNINSTEVCESTKVNEEKLQHEKEHNNELHDKSSTNRADDNLTLAVKSINLSEAQHHHCEEKQKEKVIENRYSQDERKREEHSSSKSSSSSSLQVTPRLSSLPYHIEAMGFTSNFHSCEFRILVTHMLEPLTYYHVLYSKHTASVSEGCNNNAFARVNVTSNNSCNHNNSGESSENDDDDNRDAVLLVTRMCQEVVVSAPGEPAYNVEDYDGVVLWVPSNYAFEENDNNNNYNSNNKIDMMKNNKLKPLPTLERPKVVEIPVFMCWKRSSTEEIKYSMELEHIKEKEETQRLEPCVRLCNLNKNERHIPMRDVLLRVYGSYGDCTDPCFHSERLSLLHRGFIVASAAVRGGGEFGINWRDAGRKLQRATTVNDLISVSQFINDYQHLKHEEEVHLLECSETEDKCPSTCNVLHQWKDLMQNVPLTENVDHEIKARPKSKQNINKKVHLIISGDSAGGFVVLRAAVAAPMLFHAVIAAVPFVDCLTTLLDDSLPLTITEWEEFGNPLQDKVAYGNIAMLSPYEAVDDLMSMMNSTAKKECSTNTESHFTSSCCSGCSDHDLIGKEATDNIFSLPHIFMLTDWNDSRVGYWESLKLTAKMRSRFTAYRQAITRDDVVNASLPSCARRILLHHCELDEYDVNNNNGDSNNSNNKNNCSSHGNGSGGHCGPTGRYEELHELARQYAFALIVCGRC